MGTENKHEGWATTKKERRNYGMYFMGQNMIYFLDYMFLATFLLMSGLEATKTAVILIVVKVWDAVNDCLFGNIVDEIKFKKGGKFLPWLKLSTPLVGVTTILLFGIPLGLNVTAKLIWFAVAYILWDAAYTMCDTPIFGMVTTMTDNQEERTSLMTTGRIFANIGVLLCMILGYTLPSQKIGISYTWLAVIVVAISMVFMSFVVFKGKEHTAGSQNTEKSYTLKQMFKYLGQNKYLLIFYLGIIFIQGLNTASAVLVFTCYYLFDSELIATAISLLSFFP
ncbi:MAG TPA: MFS transporter, partial [Candidatus Izemoplasmatales bacterium]|nr:MFS transporter [Candidatus Izemoplasmatales bacterium]